MKTMWAVCLLLAAAVSWVVAEDSEVAEKFGAQLDIVELANRLGFYSFIEAARETGLTDTLRNTKNITLFLPNNKAFLSLNQTTRDFWAADPAYYKKLMTYHVIQGTYRWENLTNEALYPTLVDGAWARIDAYNSTVPTGLFKDYMDVEIVERNHVATNGIIHVLAGVVNEIGNQTILQLVKENSDFSMFYRGTGIVKGLRDLLDGKTYQSYTLFAPTDAAINSTLRPGEWETTFMNNASAMEELLNYHIVHETYYANGLVNGDVLPTLNPAASLEFNWQANTLYVNHAQVTKANNPAVNGVMHVINKLLLPNNM